MQYHLELAAVRKELEEYLTGKANGRTLNLGIRSMGMHQCREGAMSHKDTESRYRFIEIRC